MHQMRCDLCPRPAGRNVYHVEAQRQERSSYEQRDREDEETRSGPDHTFIVYNRFTLVPSQARVRAERLLVQSIRRQLCHERGQVFEIVPS